MKKQLLIIGLAGSVVAVLMTLAAAASESKQPEFVLQAERDLPLYGGIPFCVDLDGDGSTDILWLQSAGIFSSIIFDKLLAKRGTGRTDRDHFCLTATDASGKILWQIGKPWRGKRPFVTHCAERSLDCADIDADATLEVVCIRGDKLLVIDATNGAVERSVALAADNAQIVVLGHTGPRPADWTILVKNTESAYKPHEYANPAWFYDPTLRLLKTADYLGAGHVPQATDLDGDGLDEFLIGFNLIDHNLKTVWKFQPVPPERWNAGAMHVDDIAVGRFGGRMCIAFAASNESFLLAADDGRLIWRLNGVHPQDCQVGRFIPGTNDRQVFIRNKRSYNQLFDGHGNELWRLEPPDNFPLSRASACRRGFHVFDPSHILPGTGLQKTDFVIYSDGGWPYVIDGGGKKCVDFPPPPNSAQDWGNVPGRPDDYGYGYYVRVADFDGDGQDEVMINDRRFAWFYEIK